MEDHEEDDDARLRETIAAMFEAYRAAERERLEAQIAELEDVGS